MPQLNEDFGGYVLERLLGKGGMAWVYLARQKAIGRHVAVKILFPHLAEEAHIAARFEREARTAGMMKHENIGLVHDFGWHDGNPFIVLEYVDGMNLREWIEAHGTPPIEIAVVILRDVARGLEHAHEPGRDVIHRDLKPLNIMLARDGMVKLLDFGLARALAEDIFKTRTEGMVAGTVPYMSPEQAAGRIPDGEAGKLSDIFSLGIVFYEVLGGRRPFVGEQASEITRAIQSVDPPSLAELNPLVPPEVVRLVGRMLEKAPQHRAQRVSEVVEVLESALERLEVRRERALMREYAGDPQGVAGRLRRAAIERHVQKGLHFRTLGHAGVDDALREFQQAVYLDKRNSAARRNLEELASEIRSRKDRERRYGEQTQPNMASPRRDNALEQTVPIMAPRPPGPRWRAWLGAAATLVVITAIALAWQAGGCDGRERIAGDPADQIVTTDTTGQRLEVPRDSSASLTLAVTPANATIRLDRGAPTNRRVFDDVPEGAHSLRIEADGYAPHDGAIQLFGGRDTTLSLSLVGIPKSPPRLLSSDGYLKVVSTTDYYGEIWLDNVNTGRQTAATLKVPAGEHKVRLVHEGFRIAEGEQRVRVESGDTLVVRFAVLKGN